MNLKHLMTEYFDQEDRWDQRRSRPIPRLLSEDVPVIPRESFDWEIKSNPNRLIKKFKFNDAMALRNFISDILEYEDENKHNAKILISGDSVTIEVYTHYLDDVTEVDKEYATTADEIYKDSNDAVNE